MTDSHNKTPEDKDTSSTKTAQEVLSAFKKQTGTAFEEMINLVTSQNIPPDEKRLAAAAMKTVLQTIIEESSATQELIELTMGNDEGRTEQQPEQDQADSYTKLNPNFRLASVIMNTGREEDIQRVEKREKQEKELASNLLQVLKLISARPEIYDEERHHGQLIGLTRRLLSEYRPSSSSIVHMLSGDSLVRNVFQIRKPEQLRERFFKNGSKGKESEASANDRKIETAISQLKRKLEVKGDIPNGFKHFRQTFYSLHTLDAMTLWGVKECEEFMEECIQLSNDLAEEIFVGTFQYHPLVRETNDIAKLQALATQNPTSEQQFEIMQSAYAKLEIIHKIILAKGLDLQKLRADSQALDRKIRAHIKEENGQMILHPRKANITHPDKNSEHTSVVLHDCKVDIDGKTLASIVRKMILKEELRPGKIDDLIRGMMEIPPYNSYDLDGDKKVWNKDSLHTEIETALALFLDIMGDDFLIKRIRYTIESGGSNPYSNGEHRGLHITATVKNIHKPPQRNASIPFLRCNQERTVSAEEKANLVQVQEVVNGKVRSVYLADAVYALPGGKGIQLINKARIVGEPEKEPTRGVIDSFTAEFQFLGHMSKAERELDHYRYVEGKGINTKKQLGIDVDFKGFIKQLIEIINTKFEFKQDYDPHARNILDDPNGNLPFDKENYREKLLLLAILTKRDESGELLNKKILHELTSDPDEKRDLIDALRKMMNQKKRWIICYKATITVFEEKDGEQKPVKKKRTFKRTISDNSKEAKEQCLHEFEEILEQEEREGLFKISGDIKEVSCIDFAQVLRKKSAALLDMVLFNNYSKPKYKHRVAQTKSGNWVRKRAKIKPNGGLGKEEERSFYHGPLYLKSVSKKDGIYFAQYSSQTVRDRKTSSPTGTKEVKENNAFKITRDAKGLETCYQKIQGEWILIWRTQAKDKRFLKIDYYGAAKPEDGIERKPLSTLKRNKPKSINPYTGIPLEQEQVRELSQIGAAILRRFKSKKKRKRSYSGGILVR